LLTLLVTLGGGETPKFHLQTDQFVKKWKQHDVFLDYHAELDLDYFGVVERLSNDHSDIFKKVKSCLLQIY
tara:strand:- start:1008 stop:1220 length:213 start_codon:yes stop_codon:yes gene_type:complete